MALACSSTRRAATVRTVRSMLNQNVRRFHAPPLRCSQYTSSPIPQPLPRVAQTKKSTPSPLFRPVAQTSYAPTKTKQQYYARTLIENGKSLLYTAPPQKGLYVGAYILGTGCILSTVAMLSMGNWKEVENSGLPWFVPVANKLAMMVLTGLGCWIVLRASGQITALNLVKTPAGVKMHVTVRRTIQLPFVPQKKIVTEISDVILPSRMVAELAIPRWAEPERAIGGSILTRAKMRISNGAWGIFAGARKLFTQEGFMDVAVDGGRYKLDVTGKFRGGGRPLAELVSYEQ